MATTGTDTAGNFSIFCTDETGDAAVLSFLRGLTYDGNRNRVDVPWSHPLTAAGVKATALSFACDRESYRAALRLAGFPAAIETGVETANRFARTGSDR